MACLSLGVEHFTSMTITDELHSRRSCFSRAQLSAEAARSRLGGLHVLCPHPSPLQKASVSAWERREKVSQGEAQATTTKSRKGFFLARRERFEGVLRRLCESRTNQPLGVQLLQEGKGDLRGAFNLARHRLLAHFDPGLARLHLLPVLDDIVDDSLSDVGVRDRDGTEQLVRVPLLV